MIIAAHSRTARRLRAAAWWANTVLLQGIVVVLSFVGSRDSEFVLGWSADDPGDMAVLGVVALSVLARSRAPWLVLVITATPMIGFAFGMMPSYSVLGLLLALTFGVYAVAATAPLRLAGPAAVVVWLLLLTGAAVNWRVPATHLFPSTATAGLAIAFAVGSSAYARRRLLENAVRRAEEAERTREALAAATVAEDRLATARDLHDIVGHQVAVINLRAGAAQRALPESAYEARRSLTAIQDSADAILGQIGDLLRDLRAVTGSEKSPRSTGLGTLPDLVRTLTAAGIHVELTVADDLPPLGRATDDALYRMVEEALTNAFKYGEPDAHARVAVGLDGSDVAVTVSNRVAPRVVSPTSSGWGVIGIRERARALGGDAHVRTSEGLCTLDVRVPVVAA